MKSFKQYITEKPTTFVTDPSSMWGGDATSVRGLINPSSAKEIESFAKRSRFKDAKFIFSARDKKLMVFDPAGVVHDDVGRGEGYSPSEYVRGSIDYVESTGEFIVQVGHRQVEAFAQVIAKASKGFKQIIENPHTELTSY